MISELNNFKEKKSFKWYLYDWILIIGLQISEVTLQGWRTISSLLIIKHRHLFKYLEETKNVESHHMWLHQMFLMHSISSSSSCSLFFSTKNPFTNPSSCNPWYFCVLDFQTWILKHLQWEAFSALMKLMDSRTKLNSCFLCRNLPKDVHSWRPKHNWKE